MQTGKLDQKIFFERLVESYDRGEVVQDYQSADVTTDSPPQILYTSAYVYTQRGQEAFGGSTSQERQEIRVQIRYRADVTTDWRFKWNGRVYYITEVDDVFRRKGELWFNAEMKGAT